jgi:hypothetical protein
MKKHSHNTINQTRNAPARSAAIVLVAIVSFSLFGHGLRAQTPTPTPSPIPWPAKPPFKPAIDAFTKVLTEAGRNKDFRDKLKLSCDSARDAVATFANMTIPNNVIIIFYEGEFVPRPTPMPKTAVTPTATPRDSSTPKTTVTPMPTLPRQNERMHVFVLPPYNEHQLADTEYKYENYLMCCYQYWTE